MIPPPTPKTGGGSLKAMQWNMALSGCDTTSGNLVQEFKIGKLTVKVHFGNMYSIKKKKS